MQKSKSAYEMMRGPQTPFHATLQLDITNLFELKRNVKTSK